MAELKTCTYCGMEDRHEEWCLHTVAQGLADEIIIRRLEQCLNGGGPHQIYEDGITPCPRCGIKRPFEMKNDYILDNAGRIMGLTRRVIALL